ncbi:MAG: T9SS type A sorting domain-containing protein [Bacteroidales bacterium]|nr:T9SS type A sorting domain-containing protein [Bacteroidales bacterium]
MRRLLNLMLAILISGVAFGQIQPINVSKVLNESKETKTSITQSNTQMGRVQRDIKITHFANPNKAITGTFSLSPTTYIPGQTMILNFNITFSSPDYEFCDGISITFPTGMTPLVTGTTATIDDATLVTPISGNAVVWGQVTTPSGWGDIVPGSYDFQVAVTVGAGLTGQQSIVCYAMGDGYGSTPHAINQTIIMTEALAHDVAVTGLLLQNIYSTGTTVTPKAIISNTGTSAETVNMQFVINDGTTDVYTSTVTGHAIASAQTDTITFTPDWIATPAGSYTAKCYLTTTDNDASNDTVTKAFIVADPIWGFAWNAYDPNDIIPVGPVKVNLATAEIIPFGSYTGTDFMPGADFIRGDWYASSYNGLSLLTIDTTTGNMTTIGNMGLVMNGLAYDATTDKLYGCAYDGSANSILYEINYNNGTYTQIGTISAGIMIGIAANSHGNLYGVNISDDALYSINKTTGAGTLIGSLGYNISYAQDIAFDKDNDKLYGALYTTEGLLCEIDTLTGAVTVYNTMTCELTGLAFPYAYTLNNNDIAITNIDLPASGCDVSSTNSISITLKNAGVNEQSNIPVKISINNGTPITETVAGPIASGATLNHTFSQNFDFSADGVYNITAYSDLATDENHNNDTIHGVVNNYIPTTVPTTINFDDINLLNRYTIIDNNGDDNSWFYLNNPTYAHSGNIALAYSYSGVNSADEYFFSSCIDLNAGEIYKISLWYAVAGSSYPESFEVYLATEPSVAGIIGSPIISMNNVNNTTYEEATANNVTVSNDGTYYISVRATSEADMYALFIDDITIDFSNSIVENENNFSIYPNPANDLLIINSAISMNQITIINNIGQVVMNVEPNTDTYQINTSTLPEGIYTARIITKNGLSTKLIVVAH